jgi:ABC-type bacteriocin/lantibiotic exporter with double-glycine peptidase domain
VSVAREVPHSSKWLKKRCRKLEESEVRLFDSADVRRFLAGAIVALLLAVAGYSIYVAVVATVTRHGKQYSPALLWTAIALFWLIAAASLWGARRIYRRSFAGEKTSVT